MIVCFWWLACLLGFGFSVFWFGVFVGVLGLITCCGGGFFVCGILVFAL